MKIGLATELDIRRKDAWSGTILFMAEALQEVGADLETLDPIWQISTIFLNRTGKLARRITGGDPMYNRSHFLARYKAKTLQKRMAASQADVVYAPAGSALISALGDEYPLAYASDSTVRLMVDYYDWFAGMSGASMKRAISVEQAALDRADLLLYPTHWAANSAIRDYGVDPNKVVVQPFGANLFDPPTRAEALDIRLGDPLQLLFCGVEWKRKGGDVAVAATEWLLEWGIDVELTILGCEPPVGAITSEKLRKSLRVIPFLNKSIPDQRQKFRDLFFQADILILPTQAECYGMVFCEAAAFGVVSIATATGGIPEVIRDTETGYTMPEGSTGLDYAERIREAIGDTGAFEDVRVAARMDFENRLNWGVWAKSVLPRIEGLDLAVVRAKGSTPADQALTTVGIGTKE